VRSRRARRRSTRGNGGVHGQRTQRTLHENAAHASPFVTRSDAQPVVGFWGNRSFSLAVHLQSTPRPRGCLAGFHPKRRARNHLGAPPRGAAAGPCRLISQTLLGAGRVRALRWTSEHLVEGADAVGADVDPGPGPRPRHPAVPDQSAERAASGHLLDPGPIGPVHRASVPVSGRSPGWAVGSDVPVRDRPARWRGSLRGIGFESKNRVRGEEFTPRAPHQTSRVSEYSPALWILSS